MGAVAVVDTPCVETTAATLAATVGLQQRKTLEGHGCRINRQHLYQRTLEELAWLCKGLLKKLCVVCVGS